MSSESLAVEFLTTAQVGEKGQVIVPSKYRGALQLEKGSQVAVLRLGRALLLIPEHAYSRQLCDRIASTFSNLGVTEVDVLSTLPEARQRVFDRHYPELAKPARKQRSKIKKPKTR